MDDKPDEGLSADDQAWRWRYGTHEGARDFMIKRNLKLSVRERLEEMQALNQLSDRFAQMRALRDGGKR
ncbi:hypothetical protein ATO7_06285 [Oceanococcus atlanticus]|uniref:Uncharacterized protein n=1 Tax=Oceanococcus atlanticus TaxID=1317117 RepID=A0A1Y1SII9_9GAMM|nr:hypothetical protein [Oceanococcus atlanticus]ORE89466.1 hypothetical protein ATO7_06285 [Oceanococcus atlanticus]